MDRSIRQLMVMGALLATSLAGCGSRTSLDGFTDGSTTDSGGFGASGGALASGGTFAGGGVFGGGGLFATGGMVGTGGGVATGGMFATGGRDASGGAGSGGSGGGSGSGGFGSGGVGSGGIGSGGAGSGGAGSGGAGSGGAPLTAVLDYIKSENPDDSSYFGSQVALSADGRTLAVGVPGDSSGASGIDGDPFDDSAPDSGAVFVFWRESDVWVQQAYIKATNPDAFDYFGHTVSLSASGDRLAVGAVGEASSSTGSHGDETDDSAPDAGAAYVFARGGSTWFQEAYLKASNTESSDQFGYAVAMSADGTTLAVGAPSESSSATGVEGDQGNNGAEYSGAVYVFSNTGDWIQQAYIKASNTDSGDAFGLALAASGDGNTLLVGSAYEDGPSVGVNGDEANGASNAGAAYVFERVSFTWMQTAYVKASNTGAGDFFGSATAIAADGNTIAVGAYGEGSMASGIDGDQSDESGAFVGASYVYARDGISWTQTAYVKASNPQEADFGGSLALSADGTFLLVGASGEQSAAAGIDGDQTDQSLYGAGAAYLFTSVPAGWHQRAYLKANNTSSDSYFGYSVALDADADVAAMGARYEDGSSPGINGDPTDLTTPDAGAAYVYSFE